MKRTLTILSLLLLAFFMASPVFSADFKKGLAAAQRGDFAIALREWTPLAEQGVAKAQTLLGMMYDKGRGVLQDDKIAVKWYRKAAKQGMAMAQFNLGVMYNKGRGVPQDHKIAVKWYRKAAEQGNALAQSNLGAMYAQEKGVIKNMIYAYMWGNLGASNGNENGGKLQDLAAKKMTPADISKAQDLARQCVKKKYKNC